MNMPKKKQLSPQNPQQSTQDELNFLKSKIDRTLMLLDVSAMPAEVKTAWVTLLPHMTLAQVDRLTALLEEELAMVLKESKQHPEDEELILKLKVAKERYDAQVVVTNQKALTALDNIAAQLPVS